MTRLSQALALLLLSLASSLYGPSSEVVQLNGSNFKRLVLESNQPWMVEFYAPWCGHCKSLAPEFEKLARLTSGVVKVGAVDMDQHQSVGSPYGIKGFPTLKFFGNDKNKPTDYQGQRQAQAMAQYVMQQTTQMVNERIKGKSSGQQKQSGEQVHVLTDQDYAKRVTQSDDSWIVEFYAPWCGHCKSLEPEWNKLPGILKGDVKVGKVDATQEQNTASSMGIQGYPSIYFIKGKNQVAYEGARDSSSIAAWAQEQHSKHMKAKFEQLVSEDQLSSRCRESKGLCVLAVVPHIYDSSAAERNAYLAHVTHVAEQYKGRPLWFFWAQAGDFYQQEEQLNLGGGYPTALAISFSKNMFSVMRGAFDKTNLESFVSRLLSGRERFTPLRTVSKLSRATAWDGKDRKQETSHEEDL